MHTSEPFDVEVGDAGVSCVLDHLAKDGEWGRGGSGGGWGWGMGNGGGGGWGVEDGRERGRMRDWRELGEVGLEGAGGGGREWGMGMGEMSERKINDEVK